MLNGKILGTSSLSGTIGKDVIKTGGGAGVDIDGVRVDKGFLRYKSSNGHFETILPDSNISEISENIVQNKAVASAINETNERVENVEHLAKGAQQAKSFMNYATLVEVFNGLSADVYKSGQIFNIATTKVPDLWVYGVAEESVPFTYTTDEEIVNLLDTNGTFQVGYYVFGAMETGKVDLEDYMKKTDIKATQLTDGSYSLTFKIGE